MRSRPLTHILGLRYRLLWAQVRTRNGKIALFFLAYLAVFSLLPLVAAGTFGAAAASVATGQSTLAARVLLTFFFANASLAAVVLGFGTRTAISDTSLGRYPVSAAERMMARQLTALLEPIWIMMLVVYLGLAVGYYVFGGAPLWLSLPGGCMLLVVNFLLARDIVGAIDRLMASRRGQLAFFLLVLACGLGPAALSGRVSRDVLGEKLLPVLDWTPPFAAANLMAGTRATALVDVLVLLVWGTILTAVLVALERLPKASRSVPGASATWDRPYDRIARFFGPTLGPLVGKMLRYYVRSPHLRFNYPLAAIMAALFARFTSDANPMESISVAFFALAGCMSLGAIPINLFGFESSGFRRYLALPVSPSAVLGAAVLVQLLLAGAIVPISVGFWWAISPNPVDPRVAVTLLSIGWFMLCLYQGLGLWSSLLAPRAIDYHMTFGNRLSFGANAVMIGMMFLCMMMPVTTEWLGADAIVSHWWVAPLGALCAAAFYFVSFRGAAAVLPRRRERLMSVLEGRA